MIRLRFGILLSVVIVANILLAASITLGQSLNASKDILVFSAEHNNRHDIFTFDRSYRLIVNLTRSDRPDHSPIFSPDGRHIAYVSLPQGTPAREIYLMNPYGGQIQRLTNNTVYDGKPSWMPDGTELLFVSGTASTMEIVRISAAGTQREQITQTPMDEDSPVISPDGSTLAYISNVRGVRDVYTTPAELDSLDISHDAPPPPSGTWGAEQAQTISWSPDSQRLAFGTNCCMYLRDINGEFTQQIGPKSGYAFAPTWSPEGDKIAYFTFRQIHIEEMLTGMVSVYTLPEYDLRDIAWRP